ncbi:reverse transcriptase domain-containing protein [Tanacetum coccineum]
MPFHSHKKFRWGTVFATGSRSFIEPGRRLRMKKTNRRTRVPTGLYPSHIEEKMTLKEVKGESIMEWKIKVTTKEDVVIQFPRKFHRYKLATKEEVEENEGLKEVWEKIENCYFRILDIDLVFYEMDGVMVEIVPYQLQNIIPQIVTQVTANVNNANQENGNGRNVGCSYKTFTACNPKEFDGKGGAVALTCWIEKIESMFDNSGCTMNQTVRYAASCFVNKALTWWNTQVQARGREAAIGMSWNNFKALLVEEFCPRNEMEKLENEFWNHTMVGANHVTYTDRFHELAKLVPHLVTPESSRIKRILTDEAVRCGTLTKGNDKRKEIEESIPPKNNNVNTYPKCDKCYTFHPKNAPLKMGQNQSACYEFGRLDYLRYDCLSGQATGQARNPLALEGNKNTRNNGNQVRGNAFNGNAVEALQDPKVMAGTFSLNNQFANVLLDFGADFSFISTKFAPLLNVEPCIINPGYAI